MIKAHILALSLLLCISASAHADTSGLFPLPDLPAGWSSQDLKPLEKIIGESRFVGLGESAHTGEDFSQAKFQIIRYLVESLGFRALAFETGTGWRFSTKTSKYVETCEGSSSEALRGLSDVWRGQSIAELLTWLCQFNKNHPNDPVKFFSFDLQGQDFEDLNAINVDLPKALPEDASQLYSGLSKCVGYGLTKDSYQQEITKIYRGEKTISATDHQDCIHGLDRLDRAIESQIKNSRHTGILRMLRISSVGVRASQNVLYTLNPGFRDEGMATLFDYFREIEAPNSKVVLWAHNIHLSQRGSSIKSTACIPPQTPVWANSKTMGEFLTKKHGKQYAPVALTAYDLSILNYGEPQPWPAIRIPPPQTPGSVESGFASVEANLHSQQAKNWLLDLKGSFLETSRIYTLEDIGCKDPMIPAEQYRAIISLEKVAPMRSPK